MPELGGYDHHVSTHCWGALTDTALYADNSVEHIFPRLGETATAAEIVALT